MAAESAPVLSTPAEHIFEDPGPVAVPASDSRLSEEQLYVQYEIKRTIDEIRAGSWRRIALQFPDDMLVDAPRVFERLRDGLRRDAAHPSLTHAADVSDDVVRGLSDVRLEGGTDIAQEEHLRGPALQDDFRLSILGDTSYGACCVDEVAAEHIDAEVVVHYGRACLSPTARLPVIYVFTAKSLHLPSVLANFKQTYPEKDQKVCLMADIPYSHHVQPLQRLLLDDGYTEIFATDIIRDPSSVLPNRTVPTPARENPERLLDYSVFHISSPATALLLILSARVKSIYIHPTDTATPTPLETSTAQALRRRYALVTRLSTVGIFGILINTLSVANYMSALEHCQDLIARAGKKSYVFVVGKVNPAKIANFAEVGGWVVIGCWESSLIESKEFFRPIITPFELEIALKDDSERVWSGQWIGDFSQLLGRGRSEVADAGVEPAPVDRVDGDSAEEWSDDEPPEFDLRTGRYVSHSRPMGRPTTAKSRTVENGQSAHAQHTPSSALIQRTAGDMATINGTVSPAANFLRTQRTWQGLGSDHQIAYERDENGKIRGALMEEGRSGIARGYSVGEEPNTS